MKSTGISRPIDELGRIVIPKEIRNALDLKPKDEIEIFIQDDSIVLRKNKPSCAICGAEAGLTEVAEKYVCASCTKKICNLNK